MNPGRRKGRWRARPVAQCTAFRALPLRETLALFLAGAPVDFAGGEGTYALCELAENHPGEHADHLWDGDGPDDAVWFLWAGEGAGTGCRYRFATLAWCPASAADGDACGLHAGHPPPHAWDVRDPTVEALARDVAEAPERWGLPGGP